MSKVNELSLVGSATERREFERSLEIEKIYRQLIQGISVQFKETLDKPNFIEVLDEIKKTLLGDYTYNTIRDLSYTDLTMMQDIIESDIEADKTKVESKKPLAKSKKKAAAKKKVIKESGEFH